LVVYLGEVKMADYSYYEELEDKAFEEKVKVKKKPKKQKKKWKELKNESSSKRNKKTGKLWSNHPNRI
tara:strand:+ start:1280 stop:1483 length:204 start_codon:yes stop_codon:yes gene_type:complete